MSSDYRLLVKNANQVVLVCTNGEKFLTKDGMKNLSVIDNGSVVVGRYELMTTNRFYIRFVRINDTLR